ncbi:MAG: hypothetical protein HYZ42_02570 [Bacteroidetes bacterium]|nr:hypothetical protein [Bacteroidota bacterium]
MIQNEDNKRMLDLRIKNQQLFTPLRLQAYERMALLLERITPVNIIQRVSRPGQSALELKQLIINDIQAEFNHNLSQQIYVSHHVWSLTKSVKEQIVQLVNVAYMSLPEDAKGIDLSKTIFSILIERDENPTQKVLDFLNKEVHLIFTEES